MCIPAVNNILYSLGIDGLQYIQYIYRYVGFKVVAINQPHPISFLLEYSFLLFDVSCSGSWKKFLEGVYMTFFHEYE